MTPRRLLALLALVALAGPAAARDRWTPERATDWAAKTPWFVGANYAPASAINQLEMWQADTFDPAQIDKELAWAEALGFNSMRVFLHHLLWEQDKDGFLKRLDAFLAIADRHQIGVMFVLFDSCWDPHPAVGNQRPPAAGVHNSGWVQSPGAADLVDPARHPLLEAYVRGVVGRFKYDRRVQVWDVWNEPDNTNASSYGKDKLNREPADKVDRVVALLPKAFAWARAADPSQPLTSGLWLGGHRADPAKLYPIEKLQLDGSDVVSFHTYERLPQVKAWVGNLRKTGRPLLCTEYMARPMGSTFDPVLGYFREQKVAAYNWGFVAGKTNTIHAWDTWKAPHPNGEPKVWFHDIFRADGTPFDPKEVETIKRVTGKAGAADPARAVPDAPYRWRLAHDAAGGNCTGLYIHPLDSAVMYVQSGDTGGYRWDAAGGRWVNFTDGNPDTDLGYLVGIAVDPTDAAVVYYAAGHPKGEIFKSTDRGRTFTPAKLARPDGKPVYVNGGEDASTSGDYLVVDPNNPAVVYFASRLDGLWRTAAGSAPGSWHKVEAFTPRGDVTPTPAAGGQPARKPRDRGGLSLVALDAGSGTVEVDGRTVTRVIYVGVVGDRRDPAGAVVREGGLWRSADGGRTWARLTGPGDADEAPARAYVAADGTVYATVSGKVVKAARDAPALTDLAAPKGKTGFFALAVDPADPRHVVAGRYGVPPREHSYDDVNRLYRTTDGGATWAELRAGFDSPAWWNWFAAPTHWLRFDPSGGRDAAGRTRVLWLGDWIGPWRCPDLTAATPHWELVSRGRGGTYATAIACPPARPGTPIAPVVMQGADFDGFRYLSLSAVPRGRLTQTPGRNDGLADGTGFAFCEADPRFVAAVGGWDHGLNGGGGASADNGLTWTPFAGKGLTHPGFKDRPKLGRVAVGAAVQANGFPVIVWVPRFAGPRYSLDWGKTWAEGTGAPAGTSPSEWEPWQTLAADPVDGRTFYLFSNNLDDTGAGQVFRSTDGGATWARAGTLPWGWAKRRMAEHHLRPLPGKTGDVWVSVRDPYTRPDQEPNQGLYRSTDGGATWAKAARLGPVHGFAFGAPAPGRANPSLVVAGAVDGAAGIFLSDDATALAGDLAAATWRRVWDHRTTDMKSIVHCLRSVAADRQTYGRVFVGSVGTGRGMFYGEPVADGPPAGPTNVTVTPGYGRLTLEWTDPIGAETYTVLRGSRPDGTDAAPVAEGLTAARYEDTTAGPRATHYYRVVAANAGGKGPPSAPAGGAVFARVEPAARFGSPGIGAATADKATDGDPKTAFDAAAESGGFTGIDAGGPVVVARLRFRPRDWNGKRMVGGRFEAAADRAGPWALVHAVDREPANGGFTEVPLPGNRSAFRYYRYVGPPGGHCNVAEIEFYEGGAP